MDERAVRGIHTDVIVSGTQAPIKVETVHGDVIVRGGAGASI